MTYADGFIISMVGLSVLIAWLRGLSREAITLLAIGAGALAVYLFGQSAATMVGGGAVQSALALVAVFIVIFLLASVALEIALASLTGRKPSHPDKIAGAVFGLLRGWLIVGLAYLASTYYFPEDNMPEAIENAWLKGVATSSASFMEKLGLEKEHTDAESTDSSTSAP